MLADGTIERIHQEDLCQALARDPEAGMRRGKYQSAGGPSLKEAAGLLDRYAQDPREQLDRLLAAATFTVLIGNADAHGKNIALLHPTAEHIELAPLYDTVPTVLWPKLRRQGAMSVGGRYELDAITIADLVDEARSWRHDPKRAGRVVTETAAAVLDAARELDSDSAVAGHVVERAERLLASAAFRPALRR